MHPQSGFDEEDAAAMTFGYDADRPPPAAGGQDDAGVWRTDPPPEVPPPPAAAPPPTRPPTGGRVRRALARTAVVLLVLATGVVIGYQGRQLDEIATHLEEVDRRLDELARLQDEGEAQREGLASRVGDLEEATGEIFDPEAVAQAALPSVFKVVAGDVTGTAFAVGPPAEGGGTNLFTNFHVVEVVWLSGGREVVLERTDQRFAAAIVEVEPSADVAWLYTPDRFPGLPVAAGELRPGQPIVSVGAPLGLGETVTTGVVSNTDRRLPDGTGPWIQFDAAVEPGNSGGPVINAAHEVVGITTRKAVDFEGIGFAVPIRTACELFAICG